MKTLEIVIGLHLLVNTFIAGAWSTDLGHDSLIRKICLLLLGFVFGLEICIIAFLADEDTIERFKALTQIEVYWSFISGGIVSHPDGEHLRYAAQIARRFKNSEKKTLAMKHSLFTIGLMFKKAGVLYKG